MIQCNKKVEIARKEYQNQEEESNTKHLSKYAIIKQNTRWARSIIEIIQIEDAINIK